MTAAFAKALLSPEAAVPPGLCAPGGRFDVYRNNVAVSLTEALAAGFPAIRALVGEEFFAAMAGVFWRAHPPTSPCLTLWGGDLAEFLATFPPVAGLPYLPDVARMEMALRESYHAADATPVSARALAAVAPERLPAARLGLAPAFRLVRSRWPVRGLWAMQAEGAPAPAIVAEDVAILRPTFDPAPQVLPAGGADFVASLMAGSRLDQAVAAAGAGFDPGPTLSMLLAGGAVTALHEE